MAAFKHLSVFILLTLLFSIQIEARDNQMFNKIPSKTNEPEKQIPFNNEPQNNPKEQEPNFVPENDNSYGFYNHESNNLPPSTATPNNNDNAFESNAKYLPKNYNPVAYVTEPEDFNQDSTFPEKGFTSTPVNNYNYEKNRDNNYYNAQQQSVKVFDFMDRDEDSATDNNKNYNSYYKGSDGNNNFNNYNTRYMDASLATNPSTTRKNNNNYNNFRGRVNRVQPQGMSDTRFLENGRYYYDVNSEKYSVHPYENAMAMRNQYNPRGMHANQHENSYRFNNFNDAQVQYQGDDNMP